MFIKPTYKLNTDALFVALVVLRPGLGKVQEETVCSVH
jgi:hypothetical protein